MKNLCLFAALLMVAATSALAQNIVASDPAGLAAALQGLGYKAELTKDDAGDPKIRSASGGANFSIFFYGCVENKNCDAISFSAGFDLTDGSTLPLMNDWNLKRRYTKAYLDDESDPSIDMDIYLTGGGISVDNLRSWMETWDRALGDFKTHINF